MRPFMRILPLNLGGRLILVLRSVNKFGMIAGGCGGVGDAMASWANRVPKSEGLGLPSGCVVHSGVGIATPR